MCSTVFCTLSAEVLTTIASGVLLAVILFFAKEKIFPLPKIAGPWAFCVVTEASAYKPYLGMELSYEAMIWNEGSRVYGTAEKAHENSSTGERDYVGTNRTMARIEGAIEKNIFGPDRIILHLVEDGHGRPSTTIHEVIVRNGKLVGTFKSMVAGQSGAVEWTR